MIMIRVLQVRIASQIDCGRHFSPLDSWHGSLTDSLFAGIFRQLMERSS
jgi:hypothetical protein